MIDVGSKVKRGELEPFELDFFVPKLRSAKGEVTRVFVNARSECTYEVMWTWQNGETCVAHYTDYQLELVQD